MVSRVVSLSRAFRIVNLCHVKAGAKRAARLSLLAVGNPHQS